MRIMKITDKRMKRTKMQKKIIDHLMVSMTAF